MLVLVGIEMAVTVSHQGSKRGTVMRMLQTAVFRFFHRITVFVNAACRMPRKARQTNPMIARRDLTVAKILLSS
jgi:hypothetical protein